MPRGGETAINLLPLLDWEAIAAAEPTWFVGFSDISTLLLPSTGRLIGGCLETVRHLAGTPYGDVNRLAREHAPDGLIVYAEAASDDAFAVCRSLHGMRLAGFFAEARAVLIGRDRARLTQTLR